MPSLSRAERRSESVLGLMPTSERSSSLTRLVPVVRSRMISNVYFPLTMLAVRATGHTSESSSSQVLAAVAVSSASALRRAMSLLLRRYRNLTQVYSGCCSVRCDGPRDESDIPYYFSVLYRMIPPIWRAVKAAFLRRELQRMCSAG